MHPGSAGSAVSQQAFGLTFHSRRAYGELANCKKPTAGRSIQVEIAATPDHLTEPRFIGEYLEATANALLFTVPDVARYHVTRDAITVTPTPQADDESVRLYLFGSAVGALLHLNGILALHGSAVRLPDGRAAVFSGISTAGKSTLASALCRQSGFRPLADDIAAVKFDDAGKAWLYPGLTRTKLWSDALTLLDLSKASGQQVRAGIDKYSLPIDTCEQPEPLSYLYEIFPQEQGDVSMAEVKGMERMRALDRQTFRPSLIDAMGLKTAHLQRLAMLVPQVKIKQITRPRDRSTLDEIIALLKADWA